MNNNPIVRIDRKEDHYKVHIYCPTCWFGDNDRLFNTKVGAFAFALNCAIQLGCGIVNTAF